MALDDRFGWLILGCAIGFVFGYIVRSLRDIKEELDEVDEIVKEQTGRSSEAGFVRYPIIADIALLLVVVLTVYAAFSSQRASNDIEDTQDRIARITFCNQQFLAKTISALNERTTYTQDQVNSNVELQRAQAEFFGLLLGQPPAKESVRRAAAEDYLDSLTKFVTVSAKSQLKVENNPYPTNEELGSCLSGN